VSVYQLWGEGTAQRLVAEGGASGRRGGGPYRPESGGQQSLLGHACGLTAMQVEITDLTVCSARRTVICDICSRCDICRSQDDRQDARNHWHT
jgi:hypothetical protein